MAELFNEFTNRQGLIVYGGEASTDYGMVVSEAPAFERPKRKQSVFNVPGRNGSILFQQDAWDDVTRQYKVWLTATGKEDLPSSVNAIMGWLNSLDGYQRLEDSFEPETYRLAYYSGGNDVANKMLQYGQATLTFTCRPERFYMSGDEQIAVSNGDNLFNSTNFTSKPLIYVERTAAGTATIACGGNTISVDLTNDTSMYIDCESMEAYSGTVSKNDKISGSFPVIEPGSNQVGINGSVTVKITPRYFTI